MFSKYDNAIYIIYETALLYNYNNRTSLVCIKNNVSKYYI